MVILEDVSFELFELLGAEGTAVMPVDSLLDAMFAVHMSTTSDVAVVDWVEADGALKFMFQLVGGNTEGVIVQLVNHKLILCYLLYRLEYRSWRE